MSVHLAITMTGVIIVVFETEARMLINVLELSAVMTMSKALS